MKKSIALLFALAMGNQMYAHADVKCFNGTIITYIEQHYAPDPRGNISLAALLDVIPRSTSVTTPDLRVVTCVGDSAEDINPDRYRSSPVRTIRYDADACEVRVFPEFMTGNERTSARAEYAKRVGTDPALGTADALASSGASLRLALCSARVVGGPAKAVELANRND